MTALAEIDSAAEELFHRVATSRPPAGPSALHLVRGPSTADAPPSSAARREHVSAAGAVGTAPTSRPDSARASSSGGVETAPPLRQHAGHASSATTGEAAPPLRQRAGHAGSATPVETAPSQQGVAPLAGLADAPSPDTQRPRVRLVAAGPPARVQTATTPAGGPPPTLAERIDVLRADDRSLASDEADETPSARPMEDPSLVVRRLAGASVEVIAGRRPAAQLARWLAPGVLDELRARATVTRSAVPPLARAAAVRGVRVCALHEHLVEATAVVDDGRRVRAIALRLESHRGAWRATALEVG